MYLSFYFFACKYLLHTYVFPIQAEYNRQVELLSEDERTIEARDQIFHSIVGKDNHGYCRTYGGGVPRSSVYKKNPGPSQTINPSSMAEIEQRIEARLTERFTTEFEHLKSHMFEGMESRGSEARQVIQIAQDTLCNCYIYRNQDVCIC